MQAKAASPMMERVVAGIVLAMAFLVMGSIFVPHRSVATDEHAAETSRDSADHAEEAPDSIGAEAIDEPSADPHQDLPSLGSLEDGCYTIFIYGSQSEPLYTVYSNADGQELATLLRREQLATYFPDLSLPQRAGETTQLMYVDPDINRH